MKLRVKVSHSENNINTPGLWEIKLREEHDLKETTKSLLNPGFSNWYGRWESLGHLSSKFDREGWPTGAAFLRLRVVQHLKWASDQFLAEVHLGPFHEGQAIRVNHHSCPTLFKYPVVGVDNCIQWKFVLESGASTSLHLQPEEFWPLGDFQKPLDTALGEVNLPFASLGAGGWHFPMCLRSGGDREEPAVPPGGDRSQRRHFQK